MNRSLKILAIPLFLLLASGCAEDSLDSSHTPEMYYVDLLDALHHHDQAGAKEAAHQFTKSISGYHVGNYPLRPEDEIDDYYFHLNMSEHSYLEVRALIEKDELDQAMIQLNKATEGLKAARIPGFGELYIAGIYDFLSSWIEVIRTSRKEDLSPKEWRLINRRIKATYILWRQCQWIRPSPSVYYFSKDDFEKFTLAHSQVDGLMELLKASLSEEDKMRTKFYLDATDSAVWALVRRFGSPDKGGLELPPEEI